MGGEVRYRVNEQDEIVFVSDAWARFAAANRGDQSLAPPRVLGHPLWDFISDPTTRHLYRDILARVRRGVPVRFTFRCDSPDCRRHMEMEVLAGPGDTIEFRSRTVAEELRPPQPLFERDRPHSERFVRVCSWCKKVDVGGQWVEVEEAVGHLGLFHEPLLPQLTHGICDACHARMVAVLGEMSRDADSPHWRNV